MIEVRQTRVFADWLEGLRDRASRLRIVARLRRMEMGNSGDTKAVGGGVSEMRIPFGPGYRVYFTMTDRVVVILLCGGDKSTQRADIAKAKKMVKEI
ncbi:MAG: type II toxin-antitoxin system RelE/ParE family toxin [Bauldia sp.]|nr:type II toxin-antitoxin system RelE/ParE family toxin [Bauldia sp.]MCW5718748.1 type II toxin-antitoxin system RelE/ParE family toxin [Bauldia sp.]